MAWNDMFIFSGLWAESTILIGVLIFTLQIHPVPLTTFTDTYIRTPTYTFPLNLYLSFNYACITHGM